MKELETTTLKVTRLERENKQQEEELALLQSKLEIKNQKIGDLEKQLEKLEEEQNNLALEIEQRTNKLTKRNHLLAKRLSQRNNFISNQLSLREEFLQSMHNANTHNFSSQPRINQSETGYVSGSPIANPHNSDPKTIEAMEKAGISTVDELLLKGPKGEYSNNSNNNSNSHTNTNSKGKGHIGLNDLASNESIRSDTTYATATSYNPTNTIRSDLTNASTRRSITNNLFNMNSNNMNNMPRPDSPGSMGTMSKFGGKSVPVYHLGPVNSNGSNSISRDRSISQQNTEHSAAVTGPGGTLLGTSQRSSALLAHSIRLDTVQEMLQKEVAILHQHDYLANLENERATKRRSIRKTKTIDTDRMPSVTIQHTTSLDKMGSGSKSAIYEYEHAYLSGNDDEDLNDKHNNNNNNNNQGSSSVTFTAPKSKTEDKEKEAKMAKKGNVNKSENKNDEDSSNSDDSDDDDEEDEKYQPHMKSNIYVADNGRDYLAEFGNLIDTSLSMGIEFSRFMASQTVDSIKEEIKYDKMKSNKDRHKNLGLLNDPTPTSRQASC